VLGDEYECWVQRHTEQVYHVNGNSNMCNTVEIWLSELFHVLYIWRIEKIAPRR